MKNKRPRRNKRDTAIINEFYRNDDGSNKKYLDALWLEYRMCKQYCAIGEVLDRLAAYECSEKNYNVQIAWDSGVPANGSTYWLETIDRPVFWAENEIY